MDVYSTHKKMQPKLPRTSTALCQVLVVQEVRLQALHDLLALVVGEVGEDVLGDVLEPLVGEAEAAGGEVGIAAPFVFGGAFEDQCPGPVLMRRDGRIKKISSPQHLLKQTQRK